MRIISMCSLLLSLALGSVGCDAPAGPSSDHVTEVVPVQRRAGQYYLVIEVLDGYNDVSKQEAERIKEFLATKGIQATIETLTNRRTGEQHYTIWDRTGTSERNSDVAKQYIAQIEEFGMMYFRKYRTYQFRDPFYIQKK